MISTQLVFNPIGGFFCFDLPLPLSFNSYKNQRQFTTKKGRLWREKTIGQIWDQCGGGKPEPLVGRCALHVEVWMPDDRRKRDPDNYGAGKHVIDCIVKAGLLEDDNTNSLTEIHTYYRGKQAKGGICLTLLEI